MVFLFLSLFSKHPYINIIVIFFFLINTAVYAFDQVHRTGYHFQPRKNWMNDPNAPMYYKGVYHLFYQYNPQGDEWGNIVWAHSVSKDLISWIPLEPALYPSKSFDKYGCWSGSTTVLPGDKPIILYTGIVDPNPEPGTQVQNYAIHANYSDPFLKKWIKPDNNPIIEPIDGENVSQFRDPATAWFRDNHWRMGVGSLSGNSGVVYLYRSRDFMKWVIAKYPFHSQSDTGMWECPDFCPVSTRARHGLETSVIGKNVKHVLKVSLDRTKYDYYTIGTYYPDVDQYVPDNGSIDEYAGLRYDYGNFYASKTFFDNGKSRRILWGWANESYIRKKNHEKGWAGIQIIPRSIWLDYDGKQLEQWPVEELEMLRTHKVHLSNLDLKTGQNVEIEGVTAAQADVDATFSFRSLSKAESYDPKWDRLSAQEVCARKGSTVVGGVGPFGFLTLASKNLEEYTPVFFRNFKVGGDTHKVLMCSDATSSSLDQDTLKQSFAGFVEVELANKEISLRSLIDHSVVESFGAKGRMCITSRVYPKLAVQSDAHLYAFNNGTETVKIESLDAWSMKTPYMNNYE